MKGVSSVLTDRVLKKEGFDVELEIKPLRDGEHFPMELLLLADPSREMVESYVHRGRCFVGRTGDGRTVGVYVLIETRPRTAELVNIAVAEEDQGKGIGTRLVAHAIESARSSGYRTLEVGTGNSSTSQLAFYQKCGFRITGIDTDFFVLHYPDPIYENGIQCRDMIRLALGL
jgi:ribosomal protein S18 acetylase RimI-like enzyme